MDLYRNCLRVCAIVEVYVILLTVTLRDLIQSVVVYTFMSFSQISFLPP
jgi:hypothetical protein